MRRVLPALGLFLLSPLVAEFLLGNLPITALWTLIALAPLYGGGALLIRESVRRSGRGWPSIVVLALAFGVLEEGIATMSLFNPNYVGLRLLDHGYIPQLGIGVSWTILVLTLHVVWSISVPIALVEALTYTRRTTPWLGRIGLAVTVAVFLFGVAITTVVSIADSLFVASIPQIVSSLVIAAGLVFVGLRLVPPRLSVPSDAAGHAPNPWLVGVAAFAVSAAFKLLPLDWSPWLYAPLALGLALIAIAGIYAGSRQAGWGDLHRLALAAGPTITYAWTAFPQPPVMPASPMADLIGNLVFAVGAIALIDVAARRLRSAQAAAATADGEDRGEAQAAAHAPDRVTSGVD